VVFELLFSAYVTVATYQLCIELAGRHSWLGWLRIFSRYFYFRSYCCLCLAYLYFFFPEQIGVALGHPCAGEQ